MNRTTTSTGEEWDWLDGLRRAGVTASVTAFGLSFLLHGADMKHVELTMKPGPPAVVEWVVQTTATSS